MLNSAQDGSFKTGKGKIKLGNLRMRKFVLVAITSESKLGNSGPTGIGKTEDFRNLIKTFADGVVASGADNFEVIVVGHMDDLGVTAGDDKSQEREVRKLGLFNSRHVPVPPVFTGERRYSSVATCGMSRI